MNKFYKFVAILLVELIIVLSSGFIGYKYCEKKFIKDTYTTEDTSDLKLPGEKEEVVVTQEEVTTKLVAIGELSTYSGNYHIKLSEEFTRKFLDDIEIWGTTNSISIECDGIIKVGYDINSINPVIDNKSKKIYIAIPEPQILDNYIKWDSLICKEKNNILNPIDFKQYQDMVTQIENNGKDDALSKGIYEDANNNLKHIIRNFLGCFNEYEIVFMNDKTEGAK